MFHLIKIFQLRAKKEQRAQKNSKKEKGAFKKKGGQSSYQIDKAKVSKKRKHARSAPVDNNKTA